MSTQTASARPGPWLERIGLHRPELRAWALYDWANSAFMTSVLMIYPVYFATVAAADLDGPVATERFAWATTLALSVVAVLAPFLGAVADRGGLKKPMLLAFLVLGVGATAGLSLIGPGEWWAGLALFVVANIGVTGSVVFADSLLPHVASADEVDRVATAGFALGYLGGSLPFVMHLAWIQWPATFGFDTTESATRAGFLLAAGWWAVFSIPLFVRVPEPVPAPRLATRSGLVRAGIVDLIATLGELRRYRHAFVFLLAVLVYNDGISTMIRMATLYGTELGIAQGPLLVAILVVQIVGIPCSFLFGGLAGRIGPKRAILIALGVYLVITVIGYNMRHAWHFFVLAGLVGTVQGGSQALSRSLFATLIPRHKSSEFFGFFGVFEKFAGVFGPAVFASVIALTGSSRPAVLALAGFFLLGGGLLLLVDVDEGRRVAREAEALLESPPA